MITLNEHSEITTELSSDEVSYLLQFHTKHIKLSSISAKSFKVSSNAHVGLIKLPTSKIITIKPKVPINNLLFMLSYAHEFANFNYEDYKNLSNDLTLYELYIIVLLNWSETLFRKGLYREYVICNNRISGIKGKYLINQNIASNDKFWCEYDEITTSTIENQIIKSTLFNALKLPLSENTYRRILLLIRLLSDISCINLSKKTFQNISYHRLNFHYKSIISLCKLIFENSILSDNEGAHPFSGFIVDMNKIFEKFVLRYLQSKLSEEYIHPGSKTDWAVPKDAYLPALKPDIVIDGKCLIDTKYYSSPLGDNNKLHSSHLYQMLTYMNAYKLSGVLVYPENNISINNKYSTNHLNISIKTINLCNSVDLLENSLLNLIKE